MTRVQFCEFKMIQEIPAPTAPVFTQVAFPCCQTKVRVALTTKNSYETFQNELHLQLARQTEWLLSPCRLHVTISELIRKTSWIEEKKNFK